MIRGVDNQPVGRQKVDGREWGQGRRTRRRRAARSRTQVGEESLQPSVLLSRNNAKVIYFKFSTSPRERASPRGGSAVTSPVVVIRVAGGARRCPSPVLCAIVVHGYVHGYPHAGLHTGHNAVSLPPLTTMTVKTVRSYRWPCGALDGASRPRLRDPHPAVSSLLLCLYGYPGGGRGRSVN